MKDNIYEKRDRQPKRRKDKYNPYEIFSVGINTDNPAFYIRFKDSNGIMICTEISREVYEAFNDFELEDLSHMNEKDRHTEHCELTDNDNCSIQRQTETRFCGIEVWRLLYFKIS